ncbi:MAG TPA: metallopeptidase TldD-related protein [Thermoanaerobaculaceae bacterium]|nr:metallopeptidase TldD-related protein [Thermoanaerobaculaceae bacterium]
MGDDANLQLAELAAAVARARVPGLVDVYLERRADTCWRLERGRIAGRETLLREGAAVRRDGVFHSTDGIERAALASLLDLPARRIPPFAAAAFPPAPALEPLAAALPAGCRSVRWRWSWAVVVTTAGAVAIRRPPLAELTREDGVRSLSVWPPPATGAAPQAALEAARLRPGRHRLLFAPAASAVLVHELFGHPLESDAMCGGGSPWAGRIGERLVDLPLDVTDDPTRADLPGAFSSDDEGAPAQPRPLLRAGVLVGALADAAGAAALGVPPGSARRAHVHVPPRPRISNLIASVAEPTPDPPRSEAAVEIAGLANGTVEPASGTVMLEVRTAFALRRGERRRELRPFTLVGGLAAVRRGLLAAACPPEASAEPGWCGKEGEIVPTGAAAPWLLVEGLEAR